MVDFVCSMFQKRGHDCFLSLSVLDVAQTWEKITLSLARLHVVDGSLGKIGHIYREHVSI